MNAIPLPPRRRTIEMRGLRQWVLAKQRGKQAIFPGGKIFVVDIRRIAPLEWQKRQSAA
jgi:hypothetical protein